MTRRGAMSTALARWLAETGGIDGEPRKLESTAIPDDTLFALIERTVSRLT